jgi:ribonucleotide reductase alpha subunit
VPTDYAYEDFKDIYRYAHEQGLKGCTTFRFNPAAFQGVLVKEQDLENTTYRFELEDGGGRGQGQRRDRVRRRDAHRGQSVRCAERRVLRQVLIGASESLRVLR